MSFAETNALTHAAIAVLNIIPQMERAHAVRDIVEHCIAPDDIPAFIAWVTSKHSLEATTSQD